MPLMINTAEVAQTSGVVDEGLPPSVAVLLRGNSKRVPLENINPGELRPDPSGRAFHVWHPQTDQTFPIPEDEFKDLFPGVKIGRRMTEAEVREMVRTGRVPGDGSELENEEPAEGTYAAWKKYRAAIQSVSEVMAEPEPEMPVEHVTGGGISIDEEIAEFIKNQAAKYVAEAVARSTEESVTPNISGIRVDHSELPARKWANRG